MGNGSSNLKKNGSQQVAGKQLTSSKIFMSTHEKMI